MSLLNFFEFLKDKEGREIPGRAKFLDPNYVFNVEDFEDKDGNISLEENPNIISIPTNNLTVKGYLTLNYCENLQSLPDNLTVGGDLYIRNTQLINKYTAKEIRQMYPGVRGKISGFGRNKK